MATNLSDNQDIAPMLTTATRHHQAGRLDEAEAMYREILQRYPEHPESLQFLGLISHSRGQSEKAIELIRKAISINPVTADFYNNLGAVYKQMGRYLEAVECYQTAINLIPDHAEAFNNLGNVYREQGRIKEARTAFEKALSIKPDFSRALNNLGLTQHAEKELTEAEASFNKAIETDGNYDDAVFNRANVLQAMGKVDEAMSEFQKAIKMNPAFTSAYINLANLFAGNQNFQEAKKLYVSALKINQNLFDACFNLGRILFQEKEIERALELLNRARQIKPNLPAVYNHIGLCQFELNQIDRAIEFYQIAIKLNQNYPEAHYNMGNALYKRYKLLDAADAYKKAVELKPDFAEALNNLGNVLTELGKIKEGEDALKQALEINPEYDAALNNLGNIHKQKGQKSKAIECYNRALELNPDYPEAHRHLALSTKYKKNDSAHEEQIKSILNKEGLTDNARMHLYFALGKIYDDRNMPEAAFNAYQQANNIRHEEMGFDIDRHRQYIDRIINTYSDSFFNKRKKFGHQSEVPVFVVGMPRSGTTLVEQIITSHPDAVAGGELIAIHQMEASIGNQIRSTTPYPENATFLDEISTMNLANYYLKFISDFSKDAPRITDKMPDNFLSLGFIRLLFPNAHIIHCRRIPQDTCLSIYFQFFVQANAYAYDLETLARYYNEYLRLMEYWRQSPHINFFEVQYEELVNNQEEISRQLIESVGLEWHDDCLSFHKNKRPVRTASSDQVRRPMYKGSIERWKNYEEFLEPLNAVLDNP